MFLNLDFHELRKARHLRHSYTNDTFVHNYLMRLPYSSINLQDTTFSSNEHHWSHCNTSRYRHGRCYTPRLPLTPWHDQH